MNRRNFMNWLGVGWLASSLPVVIAACTSEEATTVSSSRGFQEVGTLAELQTGQILVTQGLGKHPLLLVPNPVNPTTPVAVNPTCTHAGCRVGWQVAQKVFVCPCHGSKFDIAGKVLKGPAAKPLTTYEAKIEDNQVLVKPG